MVEYIEQDTLERRSRPACLVGDDGTFVLAVGRGSLVSDRVLDAIVANASFPPGGLMRRLHGWVAGPAWPADVVLAEVFPARVSS